MGAHDDDVDSVLLRRGADAGDGVAGGGHDLGISDTGTSGERDQVSLVLFIGLQPPWVDVEWRYDTEVEAADPGGGDRSDVDDRKVGTCQGGGPPLALPGRTPAIRRVR